MEQQNLSDNRNQSPLHQNAGAYFTPSFFSHGWEFELSPIHEYSYTHMDPVGSFRVKPRLLKNILTKAKLKIIYQTLKLLNDIAEGLQKEVESSKAVSSLEC